MAHKEQKKQQGLIHVKNEPLKCKTEKAVVPEETWQMPDMVGYYNETSVPVTPSSAEEVRLVKKVVCSPDLPIGEYHSPQVPMKPTSPSSSSTSSVDYMELHCPICQKLFPSKTALQAHQRTHVKESEDPYRCNICSKTFAVPARLTRHYRTHTGEKPFRCEFCNKSFSVKENLSVHRRIHTKERPYKCEVCSRAFEHSGKLHRHMRIHTGERPHKCAVCSKTFIQSGQLVIHMRTHTGEKPYVCQVCQKGFTCSKQLKVHSRTHTGEKPYSCEICGKSFGYNHVLKLHQVAHYGEKVYKCTICNDTFNSKKSMEAHIKSHSENVPTVPTPPASTISSESNNSCSSSDKEYNKNATIQPELSYDSNSGIKYYFYTRERSAYLPQEYNVSVPSAGVELLAAAASVTEREEKYNSDVFDIISKNPQDVIAVLRHPAYLTTTPSVPYTPLNAGDDIRRRVEAALAVDEIQSEDEQILTPPSSNPVSPAPSVSPDPELSLPPRKRSKMILKSMESSIDLSPVRYSSVIQYARAS